MLRRRPLLLPAAAVLLLAQAQVPSFDQYPAAGAKFSGTPAKPVLRTAYDRTFRTVIRDSAAQGPNFAGHYTIAEWGCGAGCVSIVLVDAGNGTVYRGPFRNLAWEMRKYENRIASNDDKFEPLEYRLDSRLLAARGCPEEANCASYFWEWTGSQFKLVQKVASVRLPLPK